MYTNLCGWDLDAQQKFTSITITRMLKVQVKEVIILSLSKLRQLNMVLHHGDFLLQRNGMS